MKLTKEMLLKMNACTSGFDWFVQQNETDVGKLIKLVCVLRIGNILNGMV